MPSSTPSTRRAFLPRPDRSASLFRLTYVPPPSPLFLRPFAHCAPLAGPGRRLTEQQLIPSDIKWDPNATPPQFTNNEDTVIEPGTHVRVKIIGTRTEVGEMWAIGSIKEDYLGCVPAIRENRRIAANEATADASKTDGSADKGPGADDTANQPSM